MLSKMQKFFLNGALIIVAYIAPLYLFIQAQGNYLKLEKIQTTLFLVLFFGSIILTYVNYKNIMGGKDLKWLWVVFEILGVLGIIYSVFALYVIYGFSNFSF